MSGRRPPRPRGEDRVFALRGDVAAEEEIDLRHVLTWPSEEALRQRLLAGAPMTSKDLRLAELVVPLRVGARLPVGSDEAWLVRLGDDRAVAPLTAGTCLTFLDAAFEGAGNAQVWWLRPRPVRRAQVQRTAMGFALVELE